jgi:proteasome lid subunit RPN8/RPN11
VTRRFVISRAELARLDRIAIQAFPREACGLIGGRRQGTSVRLYVVAVPNAARSRNGFRITSQGFAMARRRLRARGLPLYGCFHTHPTLGPKPSSLDRHSMSRFPLWWLIYSPVGPSLRLVRARDNHMERALVCVQ